MILTAYETVPSADFTVLPAPLTRDWMDATYQRSAYRCLPLAMANQAGWHITCPATVRMRWNGGPLLKDIETQRFQLQAEDTVLPDHVFPTSHFGQGIITWTLPFLFRTPTGYNLLVRGPANSPKDGICALEGLVETDWTPATFTVNWKITRPDHWITFAQGEPVAMVVPQRRGDLEEFTPQILPIEDDPTLAAAHTSWGTSRDRFNEEFKTTGRGWEKNYFQGTSPDGPQAPEHQTRLQLRPFTRTPS